MKKYFYSSLLVALMAVLSFSLVSCDNDDDDIALQYSIIGTWSVTGGNVWGIDVPSGAIYNEYMQIKSDGTCIDVQVDEDGILVQYGTWNIDNNVLTITITSGDLMGLTFPYTIIEQSPNEIKVSMWGITAYLVRVSDDIIDQYL